MVSYNLVAQAVGFTFSFKATYDTDTNKGRTDFTNAASAVLNCKGPDGVLRSFVCSISDDGSEVLYRTTKATDFPVNGTYNSQIIVIYEDGSVIPTDEFCIEAGPLVA